MIVNLQSLELVQLSAFKKELLEFPAETREDLFYLVYRFLKGEKLHQKQMKIFKIDKNTKIIEFKIKDDRGNWRIISTIRQGRFLVFVYAFHKKSQDLKESDKTTIRKRIQGINL